MTVFISGGCKNGKSTTAQRLAKALQLPQGRLVYLATMSPVDDEDAERIARHRADRAGMGFVTLEQPRSLTDLLPRLQPTDSVLLDSLTALLANELFAADGVDKTAPERICAELDRLAARVASLVVVSDYIYGDGGQYSDYTQAYRRGLARLDRHTASRCDAVLELCGGMPIPHKGGELVAPLL